MTTHPLTPSPHPLHPAVPHAGMAEMIRATRHALSKIDARLASSFEEAITRQQLDPLLRGDSDSDSPAPMSMTAHTEARKEVAA